MCRNLVASLRWPDGVVYPLCGNTDVTFMASVQRWNCRECLKQFSVKVGTIFDDSPVGLDNWLAAMWMICNAKNGVSSCEIGRAIGVTQKTAWFLPHRIRLAMQPGMLDKMTGPVKIEETFVGGLKKKKQKEKKQNKGRGGVGKTIMLRILQRGNGTKNETGRRRRKEELIYSQVQATIVPNTSHITLQVEITQVEQMRRQGRAWQDMFRH